MLHFVLYKQNPFDRILIFLWSLSDGRRTVALVDKWQGISDNFFLGGGGELFNYLITRPHNFGKGKGKGKGKVHPRTVHEGPQGE
jgi:hypothetical protein